MGPLSRGERGRRDTDVMRGAIAAIFTTGVAQIWATSDDAQVATLVSSATARVRLRDPHRGRPPGCGAAAGQPPLIGGLLASLDRVRMRAEAGAAAFDDAVALLPVEATGVDGTGAVTARIGPDRPGRAAHGLACGVGPGAAPAPEQCGPAVVDACRAAATQRTAEWLRRLERTGWSPSASLAAGHPDTIRRADERPAPPEARPLTTGTARAAAPARPLAEISRDAHAALRAASRPAPPRSAAGAPGPDHGDWLTLTATGSSDVSRSRGGSPGRRA